MEESKCCANPACGTALVAGESKNGWALKSGGFAELCQSCGTAYDQLIFCELFHPKESGWRECSSCGKRLHCGCIISRAFVELLEYGGVQCKSCMTNFELRNESASCSPRHGKTNGLGTEMENISPLQIDIAYVSTDDGTIAEHSNANTENVFKSKSYTEGLPGHVKNELVAPTVGGPGATTWGPEGLSCDDNEHSAAGKLMHGSFSQSCLGVSQGTSDPYKRAQSSFSSETTQTAAAALNVVNDGCEQDKTLSTYQQLQRSRHLLPKPPRINHSSFLESSKDIQAQIRVVRPPAEGRGRNQLLPRYWPRISDQELQQMTGDSNSTIVPLFEKVLSASDAGRIGRLVLPKACAEAYFPPISQPEGLPLKIQDAKGKDWIFQFRFWPNNNSRMYVLEGVTPCIQSMQLQAGDTVTFSRIEPEGKLVMGFRKATNSMQLEDSQIFAIAGGSLGNENFPLGFIDSLPMVRGYPGLLQSLKRSADPQFGAFSETDGNISWLQMDKLAGKSMEGLHKKSRNIGLKSKRLHIDNEDATELKLTWEEAQDLLRPPVCVKPSVVMVDDYEFEEYEEPPVFGKRTIFTAHSSGVHDQWAQCDHCFKWRRLPVNAILSSKWTCADNIWDSKRSSCSAPDELNQKELQNLLQLNAEFRKQKITATQEVAPLDRDVSGIDALETAAVIGDHASTSTPLVATTTRHPRHRPGCTCIVCIQPPSGKGPKHKPTCTCNVCMTVKRRFTTLMMRKKKRQCEIEDAELSKKTAWSNKDDTEADGSPTPSSMLSAGPHSEPQSGNDRFPDEKLEKGMDHIDLNYNPIRKGQQPAGVAHMSMMSLLQVANLPLENYLKQTGLISLVAEQVSSSSCGTSRAPGESEGMVPNQSYLLKQQEQDGCGDDQCARSASPE